jgi:arylsulfatase A-like enzyme
MIFQASKQGITGEQVAAATRLYSGEAKYVDQQIGRILERFKGKTPPLIMVTADHGESLGEHQYHFHHGAFTYEVCLRVPLMIWWPGRIRRSQVVDSPVMTVDIAPTLMRLAGIEAGKTDGRVLPGVDGVATEDTARVIPFEGDVRMNDENKLIPIPGVPGKWRGVIVEGHKLIAVLKKKGLEYQVYDLEGDPEELNNLYTDRKKLVQPMVDAMKGEGMKLGGGPSGESAADRLEQLSEGEIERLRSLGYVE